MPRTGGRLTRERIVFHAAELFRRKGYNGTGLSEILASAGVSKGSFYFYFDTKQELGEAVVDLYGANAPKVVAGAFDGLTWREGVDRLVRRFASTGSSPSVVGLPLVHLGLEFAATNPYLHARIAQALRETEGTMSRMMAASGLGREGGARRSATFTAIFFGYMIRLAISGDRRFSRLAAKHLGSLMPARRRLRLPVGMETLEGAADRPPGRPGRAWEKMFGKILLDSVDDRSIIYRALAAGGAWSGCEAKRADILRRAACLFREKGYQETGIQEALSGSGVPKGSFHFYFANKRALAETVLEAYGIKCREKFERRWRRGDWPATVENLVGENRNDATIAGMCCPLGNMGLEIANIEPTLCEKVESVYTTFEDCFHAALRSSKAGAKAREKAALAVALWQGHLARMVIFVPEEAPRQLREDLGGLASG